MFYLFLMVFLWLTTHMQITVDNVYLKWIYTNPRYSKIRQLDFILHGYRWNECEGTDLSLLHDTFWWRICDDSITILLSMLSHMEPGTQTLSQVRTTRGYTLINKSLNVYGESPSNGSAVPKLSIQYRLSSVTQLMNYPFNMDFPAEPVSWRIFISI